ncbi:MAG: DUF87 domain-containing protein, partial [Desulfurococcaceae archaeon]
MSTHDIVKSIGDKLRKAVELASRIGLIVGYVSRTNPSMINEEGGYVVFDVDPVVYFQNYYLLAQAGSILGVVDIKTLNIVSLQVISVERRDILAELDLPEMYFPLPSSEVTGLITRTRIKAKPLLAYDPETDSVQVANYVIEPQSPVVLLKEPSVIQRILGLPSEGVFLGYVTIGDIPVFNGDAHLHLPLKAFYQHILVLGTTGSGKTTLLKNMVASITSKFKLNDEKVSIVIIDPNRDYVTMPLKPLWTMNTRENSLDFALSTKALEKIKGLK